MVLMRASPSFRVLFLGGIAFVLAVSIIAQKPSPQRVAMQTFMRQKLVYSQGVLEGIALEKFELVSRNALLMRKMSQTNSWASMNNVEYMSHMTNYQKNLDAVWKAATDQNLQAATEAYTKVVANCVDCHRVVRVEQRLKALQEPRKTQPRRRIY